MRDVSKPSIKAVANNRHALSGIASAVVVTLAVAAFGLPTVGMAQTKPPASTTQSKPPASTTQSKPATGEASVGTKIGFVNTQRLLVDSALAKVAQTKLETEFDKRNQELQKALNDFRTRVQQFERDAPVLAESDRNRRQRELGNIDADLQRKQREIQEDFNRRRNEEFSIIIEKANTAIKNIAEKENYDLILQDAVTVSPRVDITDKVLKALEK
jgi:outer membrane protein